MRARLTGGPEATAAACSVRAAACSHSVRYGLGSVDETLPGRQEAGPIVATRDTRAAAGPERVIAAGCPAQSPGMACSCPGAGQPDPGHPDDDRVFRYARRDGLAQWLTATCHPVRSGKER